MIPRTFLDKTPDGQLIESRSKETRSVEVDGTGRFCGRRFILKTKLYGDKRCRYCGEWFHWQESDLFAAMRGGYVDAMNLDSVPEPLHCGKDGCHEFHRLRADAQLKRSEQIEARAQRIYHKLQRAGLAT